MISYQLAKKLKDAGFPQGELARAQQEAGYDYVSMPTLSVLIEVCRDDFRALSREKNLPVDRLTGVFGFLGITMPRIRDAQLKAVPLA